MEVQAQVVNEAGEYPAFPPINLNVDVDRTGILLKMFEENCLETPTIETDINEDEMFVKCRSYYKIAGQDRTRKYGVAYKAAKREEWDGYLPAIKELCKQAIYVRLLKDSGVKLDERA